MIRVELELDLQGRCWHVEANVSLGRPAPACQDPDSPAFSDPGDPPEVELLAVECGQCSHGVEITPGILLACTGKTLEWIEERALEQARQLDALDEEDDAGVD